MNQVLPHEDPYTQAALKLRASLGIKINTDVILSIRYIKKKKHITINEILKKESIDTSMGTFCRRKTNNILAAY
jgi:hypothetical protein